MESKVYIKRYNSPEINKKEILRYAGVRSEDETTYSLLDKLIRETEDLFSYNVCFSRFNIDVSGDKINLGFCETRSSSLAKCLFGCSEIVLFCATVGFGVDRLIERYSLTSPSRAVLLQALGTERVEALCDAFCRDLADEEGNRKNKIRPRFSPGYGDLPLEIQKRIFEALSPTTRIGVTLNDSLFMSPSKSVTAIIGIKNGD